MVTENGIPVEGTVRTPRPREAVLNTRNSRSLWKLNGRSTSSTFRLDMPRGNRKRSNLCYAGKPQR